MYTSNSKFFFSKSLPHMKEAVQHPRHLRMLREAGALFMGLCLTLSAAIQPISSAMAAPTPSSKSATTSAAAADKTASPSLAANPRSVELNERGVQAAQAKNMRLAEDLFKKSLEADPNNLTAVFNLTGMLLTLQKEAQAVKLLEDYTKRFPEDAGLMARLGDAYFASKSPTIAKLSYEKALKIDPKVEDVPLRLATIYSLEGNLSGAEAMLLKASETNPKDPQVLANLSAILLAQGKTDLAIGAARRAIQLKPTKEVYVTLGTAYERSHDLDNALVALKRAKDLGDNSKELAEKIDQLEQIKEKS